VRIRAGRVFLALAALLAAALLQAEPPDLIRILSAELQRNFNILNQKASPSPYFLGYAVTDSTTNTVAAAWGALEGESSRRSRVLDVTVRVGSPELDNYHVIEGYFPRFTSGRALPIEDREAAIRRRLWLETDRVYRLGSERLIKIQTDRQMRVKQSDSPGDFSREEPVEDYRLPPNVTFDAGKWRRIVRSVSSEFRGFPQVLGCGVRVAIQRQVKYLVTSEGTRLVHGWTSARVSISARAKAPDGMDLFTLESFEAHAPDGLPGPEILRAAARRVAGLVTKLVDAPLVEPYVAPAILSGRAAGVFFHEIFGHRVEGHRLRDPSEGHTFRDRLGKPVLPGFLSVVFDPTRRSFGGTDLMGWYDYDDEGVPARPVAVVENGIMKTFLMSRLPVPGIAHSNGHGRRQPGREVLSRQSNLIVQSRRQVSADRLREMLIEEIRRQGKEYGFYFAEVTGGYTMTGRRGIQAFKVIPLVVYRVYPDGRPDELVRGADIVGTPLAAFSKILATSNEPGVFNGYCGAESGSVPVSAVSPALLVSEIEVQRKASAQDRPPILPRPLLPAEAP